MKRRAKSSDTLKPLPVSAMNAVLFKATICVRPSGRTRAGRSVSIEASVSDRSIVPLTLSRNRIGVASKPLVQFLAVAASGECAWLYAEGNGADRAYQQALPGPCTRDFRRPEQEARASHRLGRQIAVTRPTKNVLSSMPGR